MRLAGRGIEHRDGHAGRGLEGAVTDVQTDGVVTRLGVGMTGGQAGSSVAISKGPGEGHRVAVGVGRAHGAEGHRFAGLDILIGVDGHHSGG